MQGFSVYSLIFLDGKSSSVRGGTPPMTILLSGLFAVTVATYGVERELYLPVELFHPLFVP